MNLSLTDKVIIVTGGARGIGQGIVQALAEEQAIPVIIGKDEEDNIKALQKIGNKGFQVVAQLTDPVQCEKAVKDIIKKYNRIDGLVNNAGVNDGINLENGSYEAFMSSLHKNLVHYFLIAHHALP